MCDINMQQKTLPRGFIGYKGSSIENWDKGDETKDWSGCYIGQSIEQAKGYIIGDSGNGISSVWRCMLKNSVNAYCFTGSYLADSSVSCLEKAKRVKEIIHIEKKKLLIPTLGERNYVYQGPEIEDRIETIIPWSLVDKLIEHEKYREYKIKNYDVVAWRNPGKKDWSSMSEEPKN